MSSQYISSFDNCRIMVVGDVMIDEYIWGDVERISPEAPVPVVLVKKDTSTLGGAGNVVNNIRSLGAQVRIVSVIGGGVNGTRLSDMFKDIGANTDGLFQDKRRATTLKTRVMAGSQHVLRIDRETTWEISSQQVQAISQYVESHISDVDVLVISDYGKGLLVNPLLARLTDIAGKNAKPVIVDPKGRDFTKYVGASVITPNKKEASIASGIDINDETSLIKAGQKIIEQVGLKQLLITCGKDGMVLFQSGEAPYHIRAQAKQVFDVSGAGDTVVAVLALSLASGASYKTSAILSNAAAGIVVGKIGTATVSQNELLNALDNEKNAFSRKFRPYKELKTLINELKKIGNKIVLTNGCFDLLHAGHIEFLTASKQLGTTLIVALDDDPSIRMIKGEGRPIIKEQERVRIISALDSVDYVTVFPTQKLNELLEIVMPDILTKGSNYSPDDVLGKQAIENLGGKIELIPVTEPISSSQIIRKIKYC